jgi:hypothetical protein
MTTKLKWNFLSAIMVLLTLSISFTSKPVIETLKFRSHHLDLSIKGTSSLHDWEIKSGEGQIESVLNLDNNRKLIAINELTFTVPSESLKSGKNAMDKNTRKALKTGTVKNIRFVLSSADIKSVNETTYQVNATGSFSIAGTKKETSLLATAVYNPSDKSFLISGTKKLKMTDYNVTPPVIMMGAIKTGDDISISFETRIIQ